MSAKRPPAIPDLDDRALEEQLAPLRDAVLPARRAPASPAPTPPARERRPRKGTEFLLPEPVVVEIKQRALERGVSATILLLELLRDAGFSVIDSDFIDERKAPRR